MEDGGATALGGFLYQLLGSAADLASATADPLAILYLEPRGEDALLSLAPEKILAQFKYSAKRRQIQPAELAEILTKLEKHDADSTCTWRLATNRPLSPAAELFQPGAPPNAKLLKKVHVKSRCVLERLAKRLSVVELTFTDLDRRLSERGRRYGLTSDEIAQGAKRLVGAMMNQFRNRDTDVAIVPQFLDEQLVGFPNPGRLHGPDRAADVAVKLRRLATSHLKGPDADDAIPRTALKGLFETPDDSITVVTGPGGCGKTLSVLRAIRDHVAARSVLGAVLFSDRNERLEELIAEWRSPSRYLDPDRFLMALERVRIANEGRNGWILVLGLDGVDEHGWQSSGRRDHIRDLVKYVRDWRVRAPLAISPLKLIITCREKQEVDALLAGSGVGGGAQADDREVPLDIFDDVELREIWSKWFPRVAFPPAAESAGNRDLELLSEAGQAATAVDQRVIEALRHPTMLGCFRDLSGDQRRGVLDGDRSAWAQLMHRYIEWFTRKVRLRRNLSERMARGMLSACARATPSDAGTRDRDEDWVCPATKFSGRAKADALHLFEDAVTSGFIVTDAGKYRVSERLPVGWRWRYAFVEEYLRRLT